MLLQIILFLNICLHDHQNTDFSNAFSSLETVAKSFLDYAKTKSLHPVTQRATKETSTQTLRGNEVPSRCHPDGTVSLKKWQSHGKNALVDFHSGTPTSQGFYFWIEEQLGDMNRKIGTLMKQHSVLSRQLSGVRKSMHEFKNQVHEIQNVQNDFLKIWLSEE